MLFTTANSSIKIQEGKLDELAPDADSDCTPSPPEVQSICDDLEAGEKKKRLGTAVMIGSGVAFAVGAFGAIFAEYFWPETPVEVGFDAGAGGGQFSLGGRF